MILLDNSVVVRRPRGQNALSMEGCDVVDVDVGGCLVIPALVAFHAYFKS